MPEFEMCGKSVSSHISCTVDELMADHSIILGYGSPLFQHFVAAAYVKRTGKEAKQNMLQDVARFILFSFSMLQYIHVEVPKSGPLQHRMPPATAAQRAVPGQ
jgi:hypothetical protein